MSATASERLGSTLFLAALVHGVIILGITFTAGTFDQRHLPSLNVTLIAATREAQDRPDNPDFMADRNQRGSGNAAAGIRPTTTLAADHPVTQLGDPRGSDLADGTPREQTPSAEQLVTRGISADAVQALPQPTDRPAEMPERAAALIANVARQTLALEIDLAAELPKSYDRSSLAAPSTSESTLAGYLDSWRRRVEQVGTANFPVQLIRSRPAGRPTLEVAIGADGRLEDIVVRRSSGDKALDQAALKILRLAAPFEPLPAHIRAEYDVLKFAYEWDFESGPQRMADDTARKR
jgi:protein TonB